MFKKYKKARNTDKIFSSSMPRSYLNRKKRESERKIALGKDKQSSEENWKMAREKSRDAVETAGDTSQYIKFVNEHILKKNSQINLIKEKKVKFDQEINLLSSENSRHFREELTSFVEEQQNHMNDMINSLIEKKNTTKTQIENLQLEVSKLEDFISTQQKNIEEFEEKFRKNNLK